MECLARLIVSSGLKGMVSLSVRSDRRQSDHAASTSLSLIELILLREQRLLLRFELHLRAQFVDGGDTPATC